MTVSSGSGTSGRAAGAGGARRSDSEQARVALRQALAVCSKDIRVELRDRVALNSVLLFSVTALIIVAFAPGSGDLRPVMKAAMLWIVLFFAAFSGLAHVFLHEEEAQTVIPLRMAALAGAVFAGKLLVNLVVVAVVCAVVSPLYVALLDVQVESWTLFLAALLVGAWGLGTAATVIGAIVAKARGKGALYGALGLPVVLPLLLLCLRATSLSLTADRAAEDVAQSLLGLVSFSVMLTTVSALVMPVIWDQP